jgi:hypothetical protein
VSPRRVLARLAATALLGGCAYFAPLRDPPDRAADDPIGDATTREAVIARLGPPDEIRASDIGLVLVYRRVAVVNENPSRYYGEDQGDRFDRYERILVYLDADGKVVRWTRVPE